MSQKTALTDPRSMQWHDVEADGDVREDKAWRELMGDDWQADRSVRDIVAAELERLAGHDVTPGHDELHHYWTKGEGLAKWVHSAHPWTALYHHLVKHVNPEMAKRMASAWFHEVLGFWPGEKHVGAVRVPKVGRSAQIQQIVAAELEAIRKFNPHEPRDPDGKWSLVGAAKKLLGKAKEAEAPEEIDAPKVHVPETPAHVLASRHDYGERIAKAAKGDTALDATPGKFSYDFKPGEDYRGKGQLKGIKGGGSPAALEAYQSTGTYKTMNEKLRGIPSDPELSAKDKEFIDGLVGEIDKTMRASRLDDDVVVHRVVAEGSEIFGPVWGTGGMDIGPQDFAKVKQLQDQWKSGWRPDMTGMQFTDHGFVSASAHPEWPKRYASHMQGPSNEPVMFRILVPKGTGGVQLSEAGEAEILLERGLSFEVVQDHGVGSDGLRRLDLRVVEAA